MKWEELENSLQREIASLRDHANRVADQRVADRAAYDKLKADVKAWRDNYRAALQVLHDENNALRSTTASLNAKLAAKEAPRSLLEKFFNLPKE